MTLVKDSLVSRLISHAEHLPDKTVFRYLERGEQVSATLSYRDLHDRVSRIAGALTQLRRRDTRAILLFSHPLEFIQAFLACLAAGVTAVPVAVPSLKNVDALAGICRNSGAACVLAGAREEQQLRGALADKLGTMPWHGLDELLTHPAPPSGLDAARVGADDIAFLQYTSGSTGAPKGVMVSHANLMANGAAIASGMRMHRDSVFVSWLPHYHDMGLIGNLLQPLYLGAQCVLMRPVDFIQKPSRWLRAVAEFGASVSGGPNFAFDLCVDKISAEQRAGLDLSRWEVAFTGAEPVKAATIARFAAAFTPHGLRRGAIYPCYGMAESTLFISGGTVDVAPTVLAFHADAHAMGAAVDVLAPDAPGAAAFVSCGHSHGGERLRIVHPESRLALPDGHVGEIWLRGDSNAQGYFDHPAASLHAFGATVVGAPHEPHLRTGDLGTVRDGELFILGRLKDVLILRGRNYYPQDLETTAQEAHPALAPNSGAAFQRAAPFDEQIVLVHELTRQGLRGLSNGGFDEVVEAVRGAVSAQYGLALSQIILIKPGQLPRTTSGKVRRNLSRDTFERQEFADIGSFEALELAP